MPRPKWWCARRCRCSGWPAYTAVVANADRAQNGMTTALIGKQAASASKARVAHVSAGVHAALTALFDRSNHELLECGSWEELVALAAASTVDLVLCDEGMMSSRPDFDPPCMVLSEGPHAGVGLALQSLDAALEPILGLAVELTRTRARALDAERLTVGLHTGSAMVGNSPLMRRLQGTLSRAADCDVTVLIEGPTGAGKSLAARIVHCKSRRVGQALVALPCADLSGDSLMRAIESARSTTLVLEDVEKLPLAAQASLVRHLKERNPKLSSPRLIVTTAGHLPELVAKGAFREDLLYRLHAFPIVVPALRERTEDIATIAAHVLQTATQAQGAGSTTFTPSALMLLESMTWPGNVSQLESTVWRARVLAGGGPIEREHLIHVPTAANQAAAPRGRDEKADAGELNEEAIRPFEEEEQELLSRALRATKGNVRRAAQLLGIGRATLYRKIQQYRLRLQ